MNDWRDPWHPLAVTVTHFHGADCPGHDAPNMWGIETEPEIDMQLTHPDDCKDLRNFCADDAPNRCPNCVAGRRDDCLGQTGFNYRCMTEHDIHEYYDLAGAATKSGVYRVRASGSGPDYWGEYDEDTEFERLDGASTTEGGQSV